MFERYLCKSIHYDESVIRLIRPSWIRYRWQLFGYGTLFIAAWFFLYPLQTFGSIGWILFFVWIFIASIGLAQIWVKRTFTACIITNQRIIDCDQRSLFHHSVSECSLENIHDIRYHKNGIFHMLANVGTVVIDMGGEHGHLECQDVYNPESVKELLARMHYHNKKK